MTRGMPRRTSGRLTVRAHAKINLNLRVVGTRPDGYHLLETVFQTLALHDTITLEPADGPLTLTCSDPALAVDERNLVCRAARVLWDAAGRRGEPSGVRVHLRKRIPLQGGLGGGSSNAAAALVALDAFWKTRLPRERLAELGACLGADVPFFLTGGTAIGLGRGDEIYPLEEIKRLPVVLVFPPFGVSTPEAFRWFDADQAAGLVEEGARPVLCWPGSGLRIPVFNDLEPPVTRRQRGIATVRAALDKGGARLVAMTGSGSTVFGVADSSDRARGLAEAAGRRGWRAVATRTAGRAEADPSASLVWKRFSRID